MTASYNGRESAHISAQKGARIVKRRHEYLTLDDPYDYCIKSGTSGWWYVVRGNLLYQYDARGRLQAITEFPTAEEAHKAAVDFATY